MPLHDGASERILRQLERISRGDRVPLIEIGYLTYRQHHHVRELRRRLNLPDVESPNIVYIGRHHFASRSTQGYTTEDMLCQIRACIDAESEVLLFRRMTMLRSPSLRADGYGNKVRDEGIFELTRHKPRVELFSVIPKGDRISPLQKQQSP